jgi:hypothetical protein
VPATNLIVRQVVHTNNPADSSKSLTDTYANDPNLMRRPASISVTTPTSVSRWVGEMRDCCAGPKFGLSEP